jgi:Bacterial SH3 domain
VMFFSAMVVLAWPFILPLLPNDWQWYIYEATTSIEGELYATPHQAAPAGVVVAKTATPTAVLTHGANMRAEPSGSAPVVVALKRGAVVIPGEVRGSWTAVQAGSKHGWVYSSYLDMGGD